MVCPDGENAIYEPSERLRTLDRRTAGRGINYQQPKHHNSITLTGADLMVRNIHLLLLRRIKRMKKKTKRRRRKKNYREERRRSKRRRRNKRRRSV